jgi:translation elongation factor EF-G
MNIDKMNQINNLIRDMNRDNRDNHDYHDIHHDNDIVDNMLTSINDDIEELYNLLIDVKNNNLEKLNEKIKEDTINKKAMEPLIKYFYVYNNFLRNSYND